MGEIARVYNKACDKRLLKNIKGPEKNQYRFMKGKCFLTKLLKCFEDVAGRIDKGEPLNTVHLDFQKPLIKSHRRD